jgi:hypothetical protein
LRNLKPPVLKAAAVFEDCIRNVGNAAKRADFAKAKSRFMNAESDYLHAAQNHVLYQLPSSSEENGEIVFGSLTKDDVKSLYSGQMVPASKAARQHYDKLLISSPQRKCPFCGFGRATTLDHFLNKSDYPWLSIVPTNLVPACKDCNHGKGNSRAESENDQTIHPYFESAQLSAEQWLFASVRQTAPLTLDYRAEPPARWDKALRKRVERHFVGFDLKARFAIEAATELGALRFILKRLHALAGRAAVAQHLAVVASGEEELFRNSWKTSLYQALAGSDWYIDGGYLMK